MVSGLSDLDLLPRQVVILDGAIGGGKAMFGNILSSWPNSSMWINAPFIEQVCETVEYKALDKSWGRQWLIHYLNETSFNSGIGRYSNYNLFDLSSIWHAPRRGELFRIFKDVNKVKAESKAEMCGRSIYMTHANTRNIEFLVDSLGPRLLYIWLDRRVITKYVLEQTARHLELWNGGSQTV